MKIIVKHLENEQLKRYAERQLNAEEMMNAVVHLDECRACFDNFQTMFPSLSDAAREVPTEILTAEETESFHLDYAEHLKPFVDSEADAPTREIVENHLQICAFCAQSVRELREFRDSFQLHEIKKESEKKLLAENPAGYFPPQIFSGNRFGLILPIVVILILGVGISLLWRQFETRNLSVENQTAKLDPQISANEILANSPIEKQTNTTKNDLPISVQKEETENQKAHSNINRNSETRPTEEEILLADLPKDLRAEVQNVVQNQKLKLPSFVAELRDLQKLRGESNAKEKNILSPNGQAVRFSAPILKWKKFGGEEYVVTIYDRDFNQIAVSPNLKAEKWQTSLPLERGKIYNWQVKSANSPEVHTARFKILDEKAVERLRKIENKNLNSSLVRGIVYASEGLLNEAAMEFEQEIKINPRGKLAGKLKNSLVRNRK